MNHECTRDIYRCQLNHVGKIKSSLAERFRCIMSPFSNATDSTKI